jgi:Outer membrane efflux protein
MMVPRVSAVKVLLTLLCITAYSPAHARPLPDSTHHSDPTDLEPEGQSAPDTTGMSRGARVGTQKDSIEREILQLDIARAELEVSSSDVWHRLVPRVSISASLGVRDLLFLDPSGPSPYVIPKDSYRLNVSLSISDVLDFPKHARAQVELDMAKARFRKFNADRAAALEAERRRHESARGELALFHEELALIQRLVRYNELLFENGKIEFDVLARSRLQLIGVRKNMLRLQATMSGR